MIAIIAALTKDRVIGKDNKLLWHISEDLKNFKRLTIGNTVIMGRKTFESIGKPLPNRHNIVVSTKLQHQPGIIVCKDKEEAMSKAKELEKDIFIIGGGKIYQEFFSLVDTLYLSWVKGEYEGNVYFPEFNTEEWKLSDKKEFEEFDFCTYKRC